MKKLAGLIGLLILSCAAKAQIVSLNNKEIEALKMRLNIDETKPNTYKTAFKPLLDSAKAALDQQPSPIDEIRSQGLLEGNPQKIATAKAIRDFQKMYALAICYRLLNNKAYLDKATDYLLAWAKANHSTGDPINDTKLEDAITAYDLIRNDINTANRTVIDAWFGATAQAEVDSKSAIGNRGTAINNWNSHRIKIITLIAYTLHTQKYDAIIKEQLEKQLAVNLNADGTTWDFVERDAFHYHTYDLEPLLTTAIAIKRATGKDYFTYATDKGASLKRCVDFMVPYMTGEKQHGEFTNSHVKFDQDRAKNGEKGYAAGTPFNPKSGIYTLTLASYFDKDYLQVINKVAGQQPYISWSLIIIESKK